MDIDYKITYKLPKELIDALRIDEDTAFETYFENGEIHIRPIAEEEIEEFYENIDDLEDEFICDGCCEYCEFYCRNCDSCTFSNY